MCSLKITLEAASNLTITGHTKYSKEKKSSYFKVDLPKGPDTISVDRLKVAYYDKEILI